MAGNIFNNFVEAKKHSDESPRPDFPWLILRNFYLFLHNEKDQFEASHIITKEVDKLNPPENIKTLLVQDLETFHKNKLWKDLIKALESKKTSHVSSLIKELLPITTDKEEKQKLLNIKSQIKDAKQKKWMQWIVGILIIVGIKYCSSLNSNKNSTHISNTNNPVSTPDDSSEIKPPIGKEHTLSIGELRYCEFMGARLEYILSLFPTDKNPDALQSINAKFLTRDLANSLDKAINDFNGRCSKAQYYKQDMSDIKSELSRRRASIIEEIKSALSKKNKQIILR